MKIRNGFVSNSSSSSFIIVWPSRPESAQDVHDMMFHLGEFQIAEYGYGPYSTHEAAKAVWDQLKHDKPPMSRIAIMKELNNQAYSDTYRARSKLPSRYEQGLSSAEQERRSAQRAKIIEARAAVLTNELLKNEGHVSTVEFSDNDGHFSTVMEFGDVFRQVPHQRCSHH